MRISDWSSDVCSSDLEPSLGDRDRTIREAFGGNAAAFAAVNPLALLKSRQYPESAGIFVVGSDDNDYKPGQQEMYDAAKAAGMRSEERRVGKEWVSTGRSRGAPSH